MDSGGSQAPTEAAAPAGDTPARLHAIDWTGTGLGAREAWPASLNSVVGLIMRSGFPMFLVCGPERVFIYNDAYIPILGDKHPAAFGQPFWSVWPEVRGAIAPVIDAAFDGRESFFEDLEVTLNRSGRADRAWFTFSYSPVPDEDGRIGAALCVCAETTKGVRARAELAYERERLADLFRQAPGFICVLQGPEHRYEMLNDSYRALVGDRVQPGMTVAEALPEVVEQGFTALLDQVYRTGEPHLGEATPVTFVRPGGVDRRLLDFIYQPIKDEEGRVTGIFVEGMDVTGPHEAIELMRLSEEQLRLATEVAEVGLWDVDPVHDGLFWPARVKAMFGISADKPVSMTDFFAGLHPEDFEATAQAYAAATDPRRRALYDVEYRTIGKEDGVVRWVAAKGRGLFEGERCVRVIGTAIDITARKRIEQEIRTLNETLERRVAEAIAGRKVLADIVEGTDAFVQVADLEFRFLAVNKASADEFERIFGVRPKAGDHMLDLLRHLPDERETVRAVWARALGGEAFTDVSAFGDAGRDRRYYEMKFNPLLDVEGRRIGAYQFVYDVTARIHEQERLVEAEEQLRHAQKMEAMGQLTGGVAHDFNNLLTPIIGSLDMLQRRRVGGEREQRLIDGAMQAAEKAKTLVQRLLAFARRQPLQPAAVDVGALVRGMADLIASTVGPQIRLSIEAPAELPPAHADENQLEMALLNLSVNARDAMPDGGELRIAAAIETVGPGHRGRALGLAPGPYLTLAVSDTGVGMDETTLARAIEPFFSTKGVGKGTGLGLSMVHGLALQLGGALDIRSQPGQGAVVELWLPLSDGVAGAASAEFEPARSGGRGRALLVDDEDLVRMSTSDMLAELGFEVIEATSAEHALQLVQDGLRPDVLVSDHLMPGMNGAELARRIGAALPGVRVLIISGYAEAAGVEADLPRLTKPFRSAELAAALAEG